jgi:hypothetical protein
MQWVAEPQTAEETEIELIALEEELKTARAKYREWQVEILTLEGDRQHLKMLLAEQLGREYEAQQKQLVSQ